MARAGGFHRGLAVAATLALGLSVALGAFEVGLFFEGLPAYFAIVAILQVVSLAGYPIRAPRFEARIRALMSALARRGAKSGTTSGAMSQVLGAVLDVGAFVLVDVVFSTAAPKERINALVWAGRSFSFVALWANLNLLTATAITLAGISYAAFLTVSLPYVLLGFGLLLFAAQRQSGARIEVDDEVTLDSGALAVVAYPVALIVAVAAVNYLFEGLALTAAIAVTVATAVALIAALASLLSRRPAPAARLARETRSSFFASSPEFALFGSAGVLVVSLQSLGALDPLGSLLGSLPDLYVPFALFFIVALGFLLGIHVLPMVLLIHSAFPLSGGTAPEVWTLAIILGCQVALLMTPFSNSVTMLSRLSGLGPFEIGPAKNWRFALVTTVAALLYLTLLTLLLV
ncbi:Hypothetical Protein RradSPS_0471 [Rubrobacter radiotolerans]|uniref:Uncharacterized protein n=1 Tax=Rubrobacter radiotolerans TaxID=42256 RepID=A0A023X111_RUBRA|nr:hypothetical protein [Rubrobacter radiotolerans]AHY45754.1 Hypothetical Protein RradSPS_0471 [Rubrobacter radiotolerans]MDX5893170.1 hypothetical protein [Rubrobacter radiotolerans]SMC03202.1 hypothetical protein SAMN00767673_0472 [Rubrobacter radiotolerans DSM 5868]